MTIDRDFYLYGFERKDCGEDGCVFLKWTTPKEKGAEPKIREEYYGGYYGSNIYRLEIPKPKEKELAGIVVITRSSRSRYVFVVQSGRRMCIEKAVTLTEIKSYIEQFFKEA